MIPYARSETWPLAIGLALFVLILFGYIVVAHADPAAVAPAAATGMPWELWLVAGLAALAGFETLVKGLSMIVRPVSKLTATTVDDRLADKLDLLHDKIDQVRVSLSALAGAVTPTAAPAPAPAVKIVPGSGTAAMLVVLLLGGLLAGGAALPACGGTQGSRAATIGSMDSGVRAAVAALRTYEHAKAEIAIAVAPDLAAGKAALVALRLRTAPAWKAIDVALSALDAANTLNDDPSLAGAQHALADAIAAVAALTGGTI